jgi:two-component system phosphate regulon sensor histidine kinase PhoR
VPVERISNNYYIVNVNDVIDGEVLKFHLFQEFKRHAINTDFEFAVYNCATDKMEYGAYICANSDSCKHIKSFDLPKSDKFTYYFGVHFPKKSQYFNARLRSSYFFTILLLIVVLFFSYTLFIIVRQRQLSEIQKNFINNLTHELKTPISSIGLSAKILNNKNIINDPTRLFEYAKIIKEQNQRLSKNVEKVLNLALLEKNKIQLNMEIVELNSFIESVVIQFKQTEIGSCSDIKVEFLSENISITADKFHFSQVMLNILENAAKYCSSPPSVNIQLVKANRAIAINIIDNGIGIPKNARKKIFQKFYRVPTGNVHDVKGFGLGLDYVKKIIKAQKWKINVENNPKGGSIFSILIP